MAYHLVALDEIERFDVSGRGMRELRLAMESVDLLEGPDFHDLALRDDQGFGAVIAKHQEYDAQHADLDHRARNVAQVPALKFTQYAQYGWHLVPEECVLISTRLEGLTAEGLVNQYVKVRAWFSHFGLTGVDLEAHVQEPKSIDASVMLARKFSKFCRRASVLGGFHVY